MSESLSLTKANPLLPAEDYTALRKQGFNEIQKMGSALWTDYNNSDPGITILEAVCYAITDLSYRTGFDVKDLLAPEKVTEDTWKQIFYTARTILHCNPVTVNDYRKMIIDVRGVRNAWLTPSKDYEVPVYIDYNFSEVRNTDDCGCTDSTGTKCFGKLSLDPLIIAATGGTLTAADQAKIKALQDSIAKLDEQLKKTTDPAGVAKLTAQKADLQNQILAIQNAAGGNNNGGSTQIPSKIVEFEGLYNVMIEYEEDIIDGGEREAVRQKVIDRLSRHRNFCEDYLSIDAVEYEDFGIGASIALEESADPDAVTAQIFFTIYKYFTPSVPFYTIPQLLEKGYEVDEIFEGPPLKHGFIETSDLEKTDLYRDIDLSDLIGQISDIPGVIAITYLHLPFKGFKEATPSDKNYFTQWVNDLTDERKIARIQPLMSAILLCKERDFISYNAGTPGDRKPDRMLKLFADLKSQERKYKLTGADLDYPVPTGENMQLQDYYPVSNSLPLTYGIGERGIPGTADDKRKVQALQLKGYMLFFEQILSDYLVQLDHLRDLFTFDDSVKHTYFTRALSEIQGLHDLLIDHGNHGKHVNPNTDPVIKEFENTLKAIVETPKLFADRRNVFLDHMLARFSEDMSEYEAITKLVAPYKAPERLIHDKIRVLKDGGYYGISTGRGTGYDFAQQVIWDTPNVSGPERRVSRLLGFPNADRRSLAPDFIIVEDYKENTDGQVNQKPDPNPVAYNTVTILDPANRESRLLTSVKAKKGCCTEELINDIIEHASDRKYFRFHDEMKKKSRKSAGLLGNFSFELFDGTDFDNAVLLASSTDYHTKEERDNHFKRLEHIMDQINNNEGLHAIEHILLRPKMDEIQDENGGVIEVKFLDICLDDCDLGIGVNENTDTPAYRKKTHRIPAAKCYDNLPWILGYFRNPSANPLAPSILFQQAFTDGTQATPLKFRTYEQLSVRVHQLEEFGSERLSYQIVSNNDFVDRGVNTNELPVIKPEDVRFSFYIHGDKRAILAQSDYIYKTRKEAEDEIQQLIVFFGYEMDFYCAQNSCDNNEDPYSFRATVVLPCWPKRFRDATYRHLVEKTIQREFPAHIHTRIYWIGLMEMIRFEQVYKGWLYEMAQTEMPGYDKVNPVVRVLNTLRSCGTCNDDCSPPAAAAVK